MLFYVFLVWCRFKQNTWHNGPISKMKRKEKSHKFESDDSDILFLAVTGLSLCVDL